MRHTTLELTLSSSNIGKKPGNRKHMVTKTCTKKTPNSIPSPHRRWGNFHRALPSKILPYMKRITNSEVPSNSPNPSHPLPALPRRLRHICTKPLQALLSCCP